MAAVDRVRKFFNTTKKGENFELRAELNHEERWKRKEAVKKVIANMTIGKDVANLFADVVKNMQTDDLEMKKLIYLYLMNYAKTQPELVILAINTFLKDSVDPNPLIRALAIRTMGCLRVEKILDYLLEPLKTTLKDDNPYVRKTAALAVAKIFDLAPAVCVDNGLISTLQDMLGDANPMVVANAVAALSDIAETAQRRDVFPITPSTLHKLLTALNECTEWGQICILASLAEYTPADGAEAAHIIEKVLPRFQHVNASVVISAVQVLLVQLPHVPNNSELAATVARKMAPPLVTLLSAEAEIQYVVLRNLELVLQRMPDVLSSELRVFFCKYNDPPFVKYEKIKVLLRLVNADNVDQLLSELREYVNEVDVPFVRCAVRAIGQTAVKLDCAAERCVNLLLELIRGKVDHVVQEAIIAAKDIFRRYPRQYDMVIPILCENLEILDDAEARAALVWILGEHAGHIANAASIVASFCDSFGDEDVQVQLQLVAAVVKLVLAGAAGADALAQRVLRLAVDTCDNPDLRDRACLYQRLLASNPAVARTVAAAERPPIQFESSSTVPEPLLSELVRNIGSLASVYHRAPALIGSKSTGLDIPADLLRRDVDENLRYGAGAGYGEAAPPAAAAATAVAAAAKEENLLDLDFD